MTWPMRLRPAMRCRCSRATSTCRSPVIITRRTGSRRPGWWRCCRTNRCRWRCLRSFRSSSWATCRMGEALLAGNRAHVGSHHRYVVVRARPEHASELSPRLRSDDLYEIAGTGVSPLRALWRGYRSIVLCEVAHVDGQIAAMWGLCVGPAAGVSFLGDLGRPWLLTSLAIERIPFAFVREARRTVARMLVLKPKLENYVLASYVRAVRFVELLGFTVE